MSTQEPICVRISRINSHIIKQNVDADRPQVDRETLLDALQALYDECNIETLKKSDKFIASFITKFRSIVQDLGTKRVRVNDFEFKKVIGQGRFGIVHVAKEKLTGDVYAIKTLRKTEVSGKERVSYDEERDIMARTKSPWLTYLQYAFQDTTHLYLVMEFLPGGDFRGLLKRESGRITECSAVFYICELVLAIHALHSMGYVHRDIQPENIFVDRCGHLKLGDFGCTAKLDSEGRVSDKEDILMNSLSMIEYAAPEVLKSEEAGTNSSTFYGKPCDYWSLGIIAYEIAHGRTPFRGTSLHDTRFKIHYHHKYLKFTCKAATENYISFIKALLQPQSNRMDYRQITQHPLIQDIDLQLMREQVPPFIPVLNSVDDTSNFREIDRERSPPCMEDIKTRTQFTGRNLSFIGYSFTNINSESSEEITCYKKSEDDQLENRRKQVESLQKQLAQAECNSTEFEALEAKYEDSCRKLANAEVVRENLERQLTAQVTENSALKRALELERCERKQLENWAVTKVKEFKSGGERAEKQRYVKLTETIENQNIRITELCTLSNDLTFKLNRTLRLYEELVAESEKLQNLLFDRRTCLEESIGKNVGSIESRLEKVETVVECQIEKLEEQLFVTNEVKDGIEEELELERRKESALKESCQITISENKTLKKLLEAAENKCKKLDGELKVNRKDKKEMDILKEELTKCQNEIEKLLGQNQCRQACSKSLEDELKHEQEEVKNLRKQVKDLKSSLNEIELKHASLDNDKEEEKIKADLKDLRQKLDTVNEEKESLKINLQEMVDKESANKEKVQKLEELLARLESGVSNLESRSKDNVYEIQITRLELKIKELHEAAALEKHELRTATTNLWRKEKELSNSEIDKRILERELKEANQKIGTLQKEVDNFRNKLEEDSKSNAAKIKDTVGLNNSLNMVVINLKAQVKEHEATIKKYKDMYDEEHKIVLELRSSVEMGRKTVEKLSQDLEIESNLRKNHKRDLDQMMQEKHMSSHKEDEARHELQMYKKQLESTHMNLNVLKEACTLLENQLAEYDQLLATYTKREAKLKNEISELSRSGSIANSELQLLKEKLREEKMKGVQNEIFHDESKCEIEVLNKDCEIYKRQAQESQKFAARLKEEISSSEERCAKVEQNYQQLKRHYDGLKQECLAIKEESSRRLTHMHQTRENNYRLNQEIVELKNDKAALLAKAAEMKLKLNEQSNYYTQREIKSDATIKQQTKLIEYLQSILAESKKKKTLSDKIFGSSKKENIPVGLNSKHQENQRDWDNGRPINVEKTRFVPGVSMPSTSKLAIEQLTQSPSSQREKFQRKPSTQRMHHNIPHRFEIRACKTPRKCAACSEYLPRGRGVSVCAHCSVTSHHECVTNIPRTCGLPDEFAQHFAKALSTSDASVKSYTEGNDLYSWIKIPRGSAGWDKKYARLEDTQLCIYEHEPTEGLTPILTFDLCPDEGNATLTKDITAADCVHTAGTDLPFIIKLEVANMTQLIMFLSTSDKEKWVTVLDNILQTMTVQHFDIAVKLGISQHVHCLYEISKNTILLGCAEGLYASTKKQLVHITGPNEVHQIGIIKTINTCLMICEETRVLVKAELKQVESLAQRAQFTNPHLPTTKININNQEGFHTFTASDFTTNYIVCAATSKQLFILNYDFDTTEFVPVRVLDTARPCSCVIFNEHSVIVGTNKYFEIDLKSFATNEFLDASDPRLNEAHDCYKMGSYPFAILRVCDDPKEFLLCYNEFACFVDEFGHKSRENDLKWSKLPFFVTYCAPFLFVIQFSGIEIIRLVPEDVNISLNTWVIPDSVKLEFTKPKYLGSNKNGIFVCIKGEIIHLNAKKILQEITSDDELMSDTESYGSDYSFTG